MNSKLTRTILIALGVGTFLLWILELRRAGMLESYWLLLVSVLCLLSFQFMRLKAAMNAKDDLSKDAKDISKSSPKKNNS
jgi:hypothetical protein